MFAKFRKIYTLIFEKIQLDLIRLPLVLQDISFSSHGIEKYCHWSGGWNVRLKRKTSVEYDSFNDETFSTDAREQNSLQSMKHYFFSLIVCQDVLSHFAKCKNFTIVVFTDSFGRHPKRRLPLRLSEHLSKLSTYI